MQPNVALAALLFSRAPADSAALSFCTPASAPLTWRYCNLALRGMLMFFNIVVYTGLLLPVQASLPSRLSHPCCSP